MTGCPECIGYPGSVHGAHSPSPCPASMTLRVFSYTVRSYLKSSLLEAPLQTLRSSSLCLFLLHQLPDHVGAEPAHRRKGLGQCETRSHAQNPFGSGQG